MPLDDWVLQPLDGGFEPRWQHTAALVGSRIIMFGGSGEEQIFNDVTILNPFNGPDQKRHWAVTQPKSLISLTTTSKKTTHYENLLSKFPFRLKKSNKQSPEAVEERSDYNRIVPCPRYGHSAVCYDNNKMIIFGGFDGQEHYNDVWIVNTETWKWTKVEIRGDLVPPTRKNHSCVVNGNKMILFGGTDGRNSLDDLWLFDLTYNRWRCLDEQVKAGSYPKARYGHQCVMTDSGNMIMLGGYTDQGIVGKTYEDIWILTDNPWEWHLQKVCIKPLHSFGAAYVGQGCVFIFGGYVNSQYRKDSYIIDLEKQVCVELSLNLHREFSSRKGHSMTYLPSSDEVLVVGGGSRMRGMFGDVWAVKISDIFTIYNVGNAKNICWSEQTESGSITAPRKELKTIEELSKKIEDNPNQSKYYVDRASEFLNLKLYPQAMGDAKKAHELDPDSADIKFLLGRCYLKNKDSSNAALAMKQYLTAVVAKPDALAYTVLAEAANELRNFEDTIKYAEQAKAAGRSTLKEYYLIGQAHVNKGEYDQAIQVFQQALAKFPNKKQAIEEMIANAKTKEQQLEKAHEKKNEAQRLMQDNKFADAIPLLTEAIEMVDTVPEFYNIRAKACVMTSEYKAAIQDAKSLVTLVPKKAEGYLRAFDVYVACRRIDKALDFLEKGIQRVDDSSEIIRMRKAMDDLRQKREDYEAAKLLFEQGEEFMFQKDYEHALELFNQAINKDSDVLDYYITRARLYCSMVRARDGLSDAKLAVSKAPHNHNANMALAECLIPLREFDKAIDALETAWRCAPEGEMPSIQDKLDEARSLRDRIRSAQVSFNNALEIYNQVKKASLRTGIESNPEQQAKMEKAIQYLDVSVKADPTNPEYILLRAKVNLSIKHFVLTVKDCRKLLELNHTDLEAYAVLSHAQYEHGNADVALKTIKLGIDKAREIKDPKQEAEMNAFFKELSSIVDRESRISKLRKQAEEYISKGNFKKAMETYQSGLQIDSNNCELYYLLASVQYKLSKYSIALENVQKAMAIVANMPHLYVLWCNILLAEKNYKGARDVCSVALSATPLNTPVNLIWRKAEILYRKEMAMKYFAEAERVFNENNLEAINKMTEAINHDRDNPQFRLWRAKAYLRESQWRNALADCENVLEGNPHDIQALYTRGRAFLGLKDFGEARRWFQKALEKDPKNESFNAKIEEAHKWEETLLRSDEMFKKGVLSLSEGEAEEALDFFEQSIALHPYKMKYFVKSAEAKIRLAKFKDALADASLALELNPAEPAPYICKAQCYIELRQIPDAITLLNQALKMFPDDEQVDMMLGEAQEMLSTSRSAQSQFNEAQYAFESGDYETAFMVMSDVVYMDPSNYEYQYFLTQVTIKMDLYDEALLKAQQLIKMNSAREEGYILSAEIYELMQSHEQTLFILVTGLEKIPESDRIKMMLQEVLAQELSTDGTQLPAELDAIVEEENYEEQNEAIWKEVDTPPSSAPSEPSGAAMGHVPDGVAVLSLDQLLSSTEHLNVVKELEEPDSGFLGATGENTKNFFNNFQQLATDLLASRRREAFPFLLEALLLSCRETEQFETLASLGAKSLGIQDSSSIIQKVTEKGKDAIAKHIFLRRFTYVKNDSHPFYAKTEFETEELYKEWKEEEKRQLKRFVTRYMNSHQNTDLATIASQISDPPPDGKSKENYNSKFSDVIRALFEIEAKQRKEGNSHMGLIRTATKYMASIYGIGHVFSHLEVLESSVAYLSPISPSQVYLSLLHLAEDVSTLGGNFCIKEKRKFETILEEHKHIFAPAHNAKPFSSPDHKLRVFLACKSTAVVNLILICAEIKHGSYTASLSKAVDQAVNNKFNSFKKKLQDDLANSDGENLNAIGLIKILDQICHQAHQELKYDILFPTHLDIGRIVVRKYYHLISEEVEKFIRAHPPSRAPNGLFQLGEMIIRTTKRLSQHVTLHPIPVNKYFTPYIFSWIEESCQRFSEWAMRSIKLDNLESVSDEGFSTSVLDIFSGVTQGFEFLSKKLVPLYYAGHDRQDEYLPGELVQPFASVVGEGIEIYCRALRSLFFELYKPFEKSDQDKLIKWMQTAYKTQGEFDINKLKSFVVDRKLCVIINNVTKSRQKLNDMIFDMEDRCSKKTLDETVRGSFKAIKAIQNDLVDAVGSMNSFIIKDAVMFLVSKLSKIKIKSTFASVRRLGKENNAPDSALRIEVENSLKPLLTYLDYQLSSLKQGLNRYAYKAVLQSFFDFLVAEFKILTSPETGDPINGLEVKVLLEALNPIDEFFRAGLVGSYMDRELSILRDLLSFSVEPTYSLIYRYNTFDVNAMADGAEKERELMFRDNIFGYLSRRKEDPSAVQFVKAETARLQAERRKMEAEMQALDAENLRILNDMSGIGFEVDNIQVEIETLVTSKKKFEKVIGIDATRRRKLAEMQKMTTSKKSRIQQTENVRAACTTLQDLLSQSSKLTGKLEAKSKEHSSEESASKRSYRERMFHESFSLPKSEKLINNYTCTYENFIHGTLFLSISYIAFEPSVGMTNKFKIHLSSIDNVKKSKVAFILDNAITVRTKTGENYFFSSFFRRNTVLQEINEQLLKDVTTELAPSSRARKLDIPLEKINLIIKVQRMYRLRRAQTGGPRSVNSMKDLKQVGVQVPAKFVKRFQLDPYDRLIDRYKCTSNALLRAKLFIFTGCIAFAAVGSTDKQKFEFKQLRCVEKVRYAHIIDNALKFTLLNGESMVYSGFQNREEVCSTLQKTLEAAGFTVKSQKKLMLITQ